MIIFISIIVFIALLLIFTVINFQYTTSINFIFYTLDSIPGVILIYVGIVLGATITIPFIFIYSRKYANNVLNKSIKQETKRLIQEEKHLKKKHKKKVNKPTFTTENKIN